MKRILVIDDDQELLFALERPLKNRYEVKTAPGFNEGLQIIYEFQPDLIFLDIYMGTHDGRDLCQIVKTDPALKHIPIILISGNDQELRRYGKTHADGALEKPFGMNAVQRILDHYVGVSS